MSVKKVATKRRVVKKAKKPVLSNPFNTLPADSIAPGKFVLIYGEPGCYKTTTAAQAPHCLFVSTHDEKGILEAVQAKVVPPTLKDSIIVLPELAEPDNIPSSGGHPAWNELMNTLDIFAGDDHDYRTLVLDTASGLQSVCHQHCASVLFKGDMNDPKGFMNYQTGYLKSAEQFWNGEFLARCNRITSAGKNIILICHSSRMKIPNYEGSDFDCYAPSLRKGANSENIYEYTMRTVSAVLFFGKHSVVTSNEQKKKRISSEINFIGVSDEGWYKAKNWYNLNSEIDVGSSAKETWANLSKVLPIT